MAPVTGATVGTMTAALAALLVLLHAVQANTKFKAMTAKPEPTLVFATTIRVAEAYANSPDSGATRDGCVAAEEYLDMGHAATSKVVFDAKRGRMRQSNAQMALKPTQNLTNIGRWDLAKPQEWDLLTVDGNVSCETEPLPKVMCPNGTLPPSCPPTFGTWGALDPFTSIMGMWYPNTSKLIGASTEIYDTYQLMDVRPTLLPNDGCGTSSCTMQHCSTCKSRTGQPCTKCPCTNCVMEVNVTRNYTYTVAKKAQADGTHQLMRFQWTQGIPLTKSGSTPGIGRDCFIFDWSKDWTNDVADSDFEPPPGTKCTKRTQK